MESGEDNKNSDKNDQLSESKSDATTKESSASASKLTSDLDKSKKTAASTIDEVKMELFGLRNALPRNAPKNEQELLNKQEWKFWSTQPVKALGDKVNCGVNEAIDPTKKPEDIKKDPYALPDGFHWDDLDLTDENQLKELYVLLNENYVEDDDNMFRFDYSPNFLQWALQPPGFLKEWHTGVRVSKNKKLVGFISAVPVHMKIYEKNVKMVEINFLCVHKKLRSKRLAPVLIKEITRRVNLNDIFQAVYTAGVILPSLVSKCRYWHRSLNPKKLIEVGFSHLNRNMTMQRTIKLYRLPESPKTPGFRKMKVEDCSQAFKLLNNYLQTKDLSPIYNEDEFLHWFLPRDNVIDSFVVEQNGVVTDFCSFYHLPSSIMQHPTHKTLRAAYSFYNVSTKTPLIELINDCLIGAKNLDQDVFNALDLMDNETFLQELKFGIGDGNLQYYLYNWKCPELPSNRVGLVLQ